MSELLTGLCPNCGIKLKYKQSDRTVMCYACDSTVEISALSGGEKNNINTTNAAPSSFASFAGFDNPESGVVFLENFFETYDWLTYQNTSRLEIPEIKDVIGNNKIKNGAIPETWYLDYMGLYVPVFKKFEALELLGEEIIEKFNPIDPTEIFTFFDSYKEIARVLLAEKDTILTSL